MTNVSTDSSTTDAAKGAASDTANAAADQAKAVAGTASGQAQEVAGQAKEQLANVTSEAKAQAQRVMSTAGSELSTQLEDRLSRTASAARTTADQLRALAEGRHEEAGRTGDLAHQASQHLGRLADRADELGVSGVTDEVTDFARRRPVAFLVGAAAAGLVVGRLARAGKEASSNQGGPGSGSDDAVAELPAQAAGTYGAGMTDPLPVTSAGTIAGEAPGTLGNVPGTMGEVR